MDNNYPRLLHALQEQMRQEERDGYTFIVKRIPDSEAEGELDPRVYQVNLETMAKFKEMGDAPFAVDDTGALVQAMRKFFGWQNDDVTGGIILTERRIVEGSEAQIPVRIYRPPVEGARPAIVFFHGGGFAAGSVDVVENPCKCLALHADAVVISVDYRLAPEHPYPAGVTDCYDVVRWAVEHSEELGIAPGQLAVAGDSAGGNLAAVCALKDRDAGSGMIAFQALLYPSVNMGLLPVEDMIWSLDAYDIRNHDEMIRGMVQGMRSEGDNPLLKLYLQGRAEPSDPYVAPLLGELQGLPETLIITAQYDFLKVENEAYARKLAHSGVPTTLIQYNGTDHAFMDKSGLYPQAEDCMVEIARRFRASLGT